MTPDHIRTRRAQARLARRRRRIVGSARMFVFLAVGAGLVFSLSAIGQADMSKPAPSGHVGVSDQPKATAATPAPRAASQPAVATRAAAKAPTGRATATTKARASQANVAAAVTTRSSTPTAARSLPFTGAPAVIWIIFAGSLIALFGMMLQIAGTPLTRDASSR